MPEIKTKLNSYALTDFIGHELDGTERFMFLVEAKPGKVTEDLETGDTEQTVKIYGLWDCSDEDEAVALMRRLRTRRADRRRTLSAHHPVRRHHKETQNRTHQGGPAGRFG